MRRLGRLRPHEWAEVLMAGAYSTDLRSRVLAAVEARRRRCIGRSVPHSTASPPKTRRASSATQATAVPSDPRFALGAAKLGALAAAQDATGAGQRRSARPRTVDPRREPSRPRRERRAVL